MTGDRERAIQAGCDGFMSKPIDIHDLLEKVAS
jgi:CheY-like chemotaxis protein